MTMNASTNPRHNQLVAALPPEQWQRWLPHLEHVNMPLAQVLYEPGGGAYRLRAELMKEELDRAGPVLHLFLRYTQPSH